MKWFFGLNELGRSFESYVKMVKVAVYTAQKFTSLDPHFLYDGKPNALTGWLEKRGVKIINQRFFLYEQLKKISEESNQSHFLEIGAGTFLRIEIPKIATEREINDKNVFYTDIDVMFMSEVVDGLNSLSPKYFAVAPEFDKDNYKDMNAGVMLLNLKKMQADDAKFRKYITQNLKYLVNKTWDQTAYRNFYSRFLFGFKWDKLPPEYNWKPYWGNYSNAKIIHFHGPKPFQKELFTSANISDAAKPLLPFTEGNYFELVETWEKFYSEIETSE